MGYEVLEHTADLRLRVWGEGAEELFREALTVLMKIMSAKSKFQSPNFKTTREIQIKSLDATALLVDFLNEALNLTHTHKEIYPEVFFQKLSETELEAELSGVPVKEFTRDIKAVTYHEAEIRKNKNGSYETILVFDI